MVITEVLHQMHILSVGRVDGEKNKPLRCFVFAEARIVQIIAKFVEVYWRRFLLAHWKGVPNFKDQFPNILYS